MSARLLITGFDAIGPTAGTLDNPSALCAFAMHEEFRDQGVMGAIIPTSFRDCGNRISQILGNEEKPDMVLMLGQAASPYFRLEKRARNSDTSFKPDIDQQRGSNIIIPGAPDHLDATLPYDPILDELDEHDLPVGFSEDAGGYLCNHALMQALHHIRANNLDIRCGFMHIPAPGSLEDPTAFGSDGWIRQGVRIALMSLLAYEHPRQSPAPARL